MNPSEFEEWNERMFKKYFNERLYCHPNPIIRYIENKRVDLILKMLAPQEKDKILDVGCGEGYIMSLIKKGEITGIDISDTALLMAKEKLKNRINVKIMKEDAQNMSFEDNSFDKVICSETLEHVPQLRKVIKEIARVSKPGGVVIITVPNEKLINRIKKTLLKIKLFNTLLSDVPTDMTLEWHLHTFDLDYLQKLLNKTLEILEVRCAPLSFLPVRYIVNCRNIA